MKKVLTLATLLLLSGGALAEEGGGFRSGEAPPPPHKLDSGYKGTEDTKESSVKDVQYASATKMIAFGYTGTSRKRVLTATCGR